MSFKISSSSLFAIFLLQHFDELFFSDDTIPVIVLLCNHLLTPWIVTRIYNYTISHCLHLDLLHGPGVAPESKTQNIRDQLIWQIEEFLHWHSIPGMIYHIRANAFRFFGLWCSHSHAIRPNFGVKLLFKMNSIHLDWITFRLHKLSSFTILHWMTLTFGSIPLWKVV